jgi:hypothetical protein
MAEFLNRTLRVNEVTPAVKQLLDASRARVPAPAPGPGFRTLPDGRVINRYGQEVYTPKGKDAAPRT